MRSLTRGSPAALLLWLVLALGLLLGSTQVRAEDGELSKETQACLKCHDKPGEVKKLEDGALLSLHISTEKFVASRHAENDCEDCHADLDAKTHGEVKTKTASRRQLALDMRESCRDCHKQIFKAYEDSPHAVQIKDGHEDTSKHAPLCSDCHNPHATQAASLGTTVRDACLTCHDKAVAQHKDWLPNTLRHFEAISCPVCHNPNAERRVSLRLFDQASGLQLQEKVGVPQFERATQQFDANNMGLDERALWSLLKEFSQPDKAGSAVLRGRLEVASGVQAHQISDKAHAIKDCNTCHKAGAAAFQSVSLTMAGPDGQPLRHSVQKDVLTSLLATQSIRGFYAIGSTRIQWLDVLLVLVVLGACCVPLAHMGVHRLFRSYREGLQAHKQADSNADSNADGKGL